MTFRTIFIGAKTLWPRVIETAYVLFSVLAAIFLYACSSSEVRAFLASQEQEAVLRHPVLIVLTVVLLGWQYLRAGKINSWAARSWLLMGGAASLYAGIFADSARFEALAAIMLIPLWMSIPQWSDIFRGISAKRPSHFSTWVHVIGCGAVVFCVCSLVQAICTLGVYPMPQMPIYSLFQIVANSSLHASMIAIVGFVVCLVGCICVRQIGRIAGSRASRFLRSLAVTCVALGISAIILNGIRAISVAWRAPHHLLFALWIAAPLALSIAHNLSISQATDLATAVARYGRDGVGRVPGIAKVLARGGWPLRHGLKLILFAIFLWSQWKIRGWHIKYGWGTGTAILYDTVALGTAAYLFTIAGQVTQARLLRVSLLFLLLLNVHAVVWPVDAPTWAAYSKYDRSRWAIRKLWYHLYPNPHPEYVRLRKHIEQSMDYRGSNMPARWPTRFTQKLDAAKRPNVLLIVVDSLRKSSYDAQNPSDMAGLDFIRKHFVNYAHTWSSYNATIGSMPALFSGALQPIWFRASIEDGVHYRNTLAEGLVAAGYDIYDGGNYLDYAYYWPNPGKPFLTPGGDGLGDPMHILPQALELLLQNSRSTQAQPFAAYLQLYNIHEPLRRRDDIPFPADEANWVRALYGQNVRYLDRSLYRFFHDLDAEGILDDTLVILTADHGEELFDAGGLYHGCQINPFVLEVPLYVHYPRGVSNAPAPGTVIEQGANLVDVVPTILGVLGVDIPRERDIQGVDLRLLATVPPRVFPALSWYTMEVGLIHSNPPRLEVVDSESGVLETYWHRGGAWSLDASERSAAEVGAEIAGLLGKIHDSWR